MIERDLKQKNRSFSQPQACGLAAGILQQVGFRSGEVLVAKKPSAVAAPRENPEA